MGKIEEMGGLFCTSWGGEDSGRPDRLTREPYAIAAFFRTIRSSRKVVTTDNTVDDRVPGVGRARPARSDRPIMVVALEVFDVGSCVGPEILSVT